MNRVSLPPTHQRLSSLSMISTGTVTALPGYARTEPVLPEYAGLYPPPQTRSDETPSTRHSFPFEKKNPNWATLELMSHAKSVDSIPLLYSGNILKGAIHLNLREPTTIRNIAVSFRVTIVLKIAALRKHTLFEQPLLVYEPSGKKDRLSGTVEFPFDSTVPTTTSEFDNKGLPRQFRLPEYFYEANNSVQVVYEMVARIERGKFQSNVELCTKFLFTPKVQPRPSSALRQAADLYNLPLPSPDADPAGWLALPIECPGRFKHGSDGILTGTVYLSNPLVFTRGSSTSILVKLNDLPSGLQPTNLVSVYLKRRVEFLDPTSDRGRNTRRGGKNLTDFEMKVSRACWYSSHRNDGLSEGEIHVYRELQASSNHPLFAIEYSLVVLPTSTSDFVPLDSKTPLAIQQVDVATEYAVGPRPRAVTRPSAPSWLRQENPLMSHVNLNNGMMPGSIGGARAGLPPVHRERPDGYEGLSLEV